jgi:NitT/TauT family transport system substrate-binding protein
MSHISNNNIRIILISSIIVILISNPFASIDAQTVPIKKPITLGMGIWIPNFLAYVAQEKGYFKKNNVDVNVKLFPLYDEALMHMLMGTLMDFLVFIRIS